MTDERGEEATRGSDGEAAAGPRPFIDDVFAALADWRRREICHFFAETGTDAATVDELAMLVAGCRPSGASGDRPHDAIADELVNVHLPALEAVGAVDYDGRSGTVRYRGQPTLEKWLEHVRAVDGRTG